MGNDDDSHLFPASRRLETKRRALPLGAANAAFTRDRGHSHDEGQKHENCNLLCDIA